MYIIIIIINKPCGLCGSKVRQQKEVSVSRRLPLALDSLNLVRKLRCKLEFFGTRTCGYRMGNTSFNNYYNNAKDFTGEGTRRERTSHVRLCQFQGG